MIVDEHRRRAVPAAQPGREAVGLGVRDREIVEVWRDAGDDPRGDQQPAGVVVGQALPLPCVVTGSWYRD